MSKFIKVDVDLTEFNSAFSRYMTLTSSTLVKAMANKLFDMARFAYKANYQVNPNTIRKALNEKCYRYPKMTIAEAVVMKKHGGHFLDITNKQLKAEAQKFKNTMASHAGYTKTGWIPAMRKLMAEVNKADFTVNSNTSLIGQGGATTVKQNGSTLEGSCWNDVKGGRKEGKVTNYKSKAAQEAVDKVSADIEGYIDRKMQESADATINK